MLITELISVLSEVYYSHWPGLGQALMFEPCLTQIMPIISGRSIFVLEKIRKLLGKKGNGVLGSHKQQMSSIIFLHDYPRGPSALVNNATWTWGDFLICTFLPAVTFHSILDPTNPSILWKTFSQKCSLNSGGTERSAHFPEVCVGKSSVSFLTVNFAMYSGGGSILFT